MYYFIIERQIIIENVIVIALFVLQKLDLKMVSNVLQTSDVSCFGNSFMATGCTLLHKKLCQKPLTAVH